MDARACTQTWRWGGAEGEPRGAPLRGTPGKKPAAEVEGASEGKRRGWSLVARGEGLREGAPKRAAGETSPCVRPPAPAINFELLQLEVASLKVFLSTSRPPSRTMLALYAALSLLALCAPSCFAQASCCRDECMTAPPAAPSDTSCFLGYVGGTGGNAPQLYPITIASGLLCQTWVVPCSTELIASGACSALGSEVTQLLYAAADDVARQIASGAHSYYLQQFKIAWCNTNGCNTPAFAADCLQRTPTGSPAPQTPSAPQTQSSTRTPGLVVSSPQTPSAPQTPSGTRTPGLVVSSCCGEGCKSSSMAPVPAPLQCWQGAEGSLIAVQSPSDSWCGSYDTTCGGELG